MISLIKSTFHNEAETKKKLSKFLLEADKLSMGEYCLRFEDSLETWQGRKNAVLVNSGSSANLALLQALMNLGRLKKGDRVGFSALTWATNVMPIIQLGLIPVPIDVEIETLNIASDLVDKNFVEVLFVTNLLGLCGDLDAIAEICEETKTILIEDNCESMGSIYDGERLGNFGLASTFSFYVGHHLSTIEGGAVMTDDDELADMLRMVRAHGWKRDIADSLDFYGRYTFFDLGFNFRPTEITGFLGYNGMDYIEEIVWNRENNARFLSDIYNNSKAYELITGHMDVYSSFSTPIVYKKESHKNEVVKHCEMMDIEVRPIVAGNITRQPFFMKYVGKASCPNAELIHTNGLYAPNNPDLTFNELETIKEALWLK